MRHNWRASLKKFCFLSESLTHSVFTSSVIGHIFACICEVQLRLCVYVLFFFREKVFVCSSSNLIFLISCFALFPFFFKKSHFHYRAIILYRSQKLASILAFPVECKFTYCFVFSNGVSFEYIVVMAGQLEVDLTFSMSKSYYYARCLLCLINNRRIID